jgi:hypothetical protein
MISISGVIGPDKRSGPDEDDYQLRASSSELTYTPTSTTAKFTQPITGNAYEDGSLGELGGWLVFELPDDITNPTFSVRQSDISWPLSLSRETRVLFDVSIKSPTNVVLGNEFEYTLEISNTGGRAGKIYYPTGLGEPIKQSVAAGETKQVSRSIDVRGYNGGKLTIDTPRGTTEVNILPVTALFGNQLITPKGMKMTLQQPVATDSIDYESIYTQGGTQTDSAGNGLQYLVAKGQISNPTAESHIYPLGNGTAITPDDEYSPYIPTRNSSSVLLKSPVSGPIHGSVDSYDNVLPAGDSTDFVTIWRVPDNITVDDVSVKYEYAKSIKNPTKVLRFSNE